MEPHSYKNEDGEIRSSNINDEGLDADLDVESVKLLRDFFEPHNRELYKMLGIDFGWEAEIDEFLASREKTEL